MAERVILHIGAPKCGTTYLQTLLWSHKDRLAGDGLLVPGSVKFDHNRAAHVATRAHPDPLSRQVWADMRSQIAQWPGTAVVSNEWFSLAGPVRAARAVQALARDLVRAVPSAWQETLKLGTARQLSQFIADLDEPRGRWRWSTLDPSTMLERWSGAVPTDRIHVVTVPRSRTDPGLLWRRFAHVCGLAEPDAYDLDVGTSNESIGAESALLLQRVGPRLRAAIDVPDVAWNVPYDWIRERISHEVLVPRGGSPIALDEDVLRRLRERSQRSVDSLSSVGYDIVGELDELTGASVPPDAIHPEDAPAERVLPLAEDVLVAMLRQAYTESLRADRAEARIAQLEAGPPPDGRRGGGDLVRRLGLRLSRRLRR
jgi:hypothetical protein